MFCEAFVKYGQKTWISTQCTTSSHRSLHEWEAPLRSWQRREQGAQSLLLSLPTAKGPSAYACRWAWFLTEQGGTVGPITLSFWGGETCFSLPAWDKVHRGWWTLSSTWCLKTCRRWNFLMETGGVFTYKREGCSPPGSVCLLLSSVIWSGKKFYSSSHPAQLQPQWRDWASRLKGKAFGTNYCCYCYLGEGMFPVVLPEIWVRGQHLMNRCWWFTSGTSEIAHGFHFTKAPSRQKLQEMQYRLPGDAAWLCGAVLAFDRQGKSCGSSEKL